jgi:hypothetical protein
MRSRLRRQPNDFNLIVNHYKRKSCFEEYSQQVITFHHSQTSSHTHRSRQKMKLRSSKIQYICLSWELGLIWG